MGPKGSVGPVEAAAEVSDETCVGAELAVGASDVEDGTSGVVAEVSATVVSVGCAALEVSTLASGSLVAPASVSTGSLVSVADASAPASPASDPTIVSRVGRSVVVVPTAVVVGTVVVVDEAAVDVDTEEVVAGDVVAGDVVVAEVSADVGAPDVVDEAEVGSDVVEVEEVVKAGTVEPPPVSSEQPLIVTSAAPSNQGAPVPTRRVGFDSGFRFIKLPYAKRPEAKSMNHFARSFQRIPSTVATPGGFVGW